MTYYLKYRSKTIDELDLKEVRETLSKIIVSGQIPHAFLFSGPKGSGKTSAARIIAKVVNCENPNPKTGEPCNKCANCLSIIKGDDLDVIEIDAASHRGIDDIRTLRDAVKLSPARAKRKVYIIDEAHMLTAEASNALLKTLEEPPEHVIFILATTNPEKLIDTIRSRTANINFTKANREEIVRSLARVSAGEKLKLDEETLGIIASASDGSFRDAIKIIEELVIGGVKLEKASIEEYLFKRKDFDPVGFVKIFKEGDEKSAYAEIEKAVESGVSIKNITASILGHLQKILLAKVGISGEDESSFTKEEILELIGLISRSFSEVGYAVLEQIPLELSVSEWFAKRSENSAFEDSSGGHGSKAKSSENPGIGLKKKQESKQKLSNHQKSQHKKSLNDQKNASNSSFNGFGDEDWIKILTQIKPKNASTEALLRAAKPLDYDGKTLTLGVYYKFHKEKLETNLHRSLLESVLQNVKGNDVRVCCTLTEPPVKKKTSDEGSPHAVTNGAGVSEGTDAVLTEGEDEEIVKIAKEIFGG